jgi:hypothetical protein
MLPADHSSRGTHAHWAARAYRPARYPLSGGGNVEATTTQADRAGREDFVAPIKLKLYLFDLLWICCRTSCTANPQQIHNFLTNPQQIHSISTCQDVVDLLWTLQQFRNKSNRWSLSFIALEFFGLQSFILCKTYMLLACL